MTLLNMTNEIQVKGTQNFMGAEISVIEGGFGTDKKCITDKTIAEIHNMQVKHVRENINKNIKRFKIDIDYINLKEVGDADHNLELLESLGYSKMQISKSENIFLLSERGYAKLIKIMDTDLAWEIHDKLMDEYFDMREIINSNEQLKANLLLQIYNGGQQGVIASKQLTEIEVQEATTPLLNKIEEDKPLVEFAETISKTSDSIDIGTFSKLVKDQDIKIGRNKLFEWLRDNGYLMKNNIPYQKYIDNNSDAYADFAKLILSELEAMEQGNAEAVENCNANGDSNVNAEAKESAEAQSTSEGDKCSGGDDVREQADAPQSTESAAQEQSKREKPKGRKIADLSEFCG